VEKAVSLTPIFRYLQAHSIPFMVFINKMDQATQSVESVMDALQGVCSRPLVLRQIPIANGESAAGYVDLVSERAYKYQPGKASDLISIPAEITDDEEIARQVMLESLVDFDDALMEQLLEDAIPATEDVYQQLTKDLRAGLIVPIFVGAAEHDPGVRRLLEALRHETPDPDQTAERLGIEKTGEAVVQVFKTVHAAHAGKLSIARVWRGEISEGGLLNGHRVGGLARLMGANQTKLAKATLGDVVALGQMDEVHSGDVLTPSGAQPGGLADWLAALTPVYSFGVEAENRADEVKLSRALQRLSEEDPSISYRQDNDVRQMLLGQGEIHLPLAIDRLKNKFNVAAVTMKPKVPYKETIRKPVSQHARFKRQTGGHGMFADVHVDIKTMPRGGGFEFCNSVVGGSVPKQYIPAV
jgi:elongation factor G